MNNYDNYYSDGMFAWQFVVSLLSIGFGLIADTFNRSGKLESLSVHSGIPIGVYVSLASFALINVGYSVYRWLAVSSGGWLAY